MFKKLLIANRGEIACRIIKTAQTLNIPTLAVYSDIDQNSLAVEMADEAYCIGGSLPADSYLHIANIIDCAKKHGVDVIHPGYGFLSENPLFAAACAKANIVFVGPSVRALEIMGSKQLSKQLLETTDVPLTRGYHGDEQSPEYLLQKAHDIGFPVLIKAAAGGGGKGMRAVYEAKEFMPAIAGAKREAMANFADDTLIIEQLLLNPRHIEVQIMADKQGNVLHLFERDCSIQRRHQKIIEEARAVNLNQALLDKLHEAACTVAKTIAYEGAGTIEFLVDANDKFYFMEMNTRLQVEHPVTEMITGLDLVALQLEIASGQPLKLKQKDIVSQGHAIECRIYAEDPKQAFMPSVGTISTLELPEGVGIRLDTGIREHDTISQYYDPMIAKLIAYGETRSMAIGRLLNALTHYHIAGIKTNIAFLIGICSQKAFLAGDYGTDFLTKALSSDLQQHTIHIPTLDPCLALLFVSSFNYHSLMTAHDDPLYQATFAFDAFNKRYWPCYYQIGSDHYTVELTPIDEHSFKFTLKSMASKDLSPTETQTILFTIADIREKLTKITLSLNGKHTIAYIQKNHANTYTVFKEGSALLIEQQASPFVEKTSTLVNELKAPMASTIISILKNIGSVVKKGEPLIILEAMKMEHTLYAPYDGILTEQFYDTGQTVLEGAELLVITEPTKN